jgi:hypothetical protein
MGLWQGLFLLPGHVERCRPRNQTPDSSQRRRCGNFTGNITMTITKSLSVDINRHHDLARTKAAEAINHAMEAGKLLLQAKAGMEHGAWGSWLRSNVRVTPRQAQRYMALAQGKPVPIRAIAKNDTVSHLPIAVDAWPAPEWKPTLGHWMHTITDGAAWWVVPSIADPKFFHISKFWNLAAPEATDGATDWDGSSMYDGTKRPVRFDAVEHFLKHLGMKEPAAADWGSSERSGLLRPFGEPERPSIQEMAA